MWHWIKRFFANPVPAFDDEIRQLELAELANIQMAMPVAIKERDRLKRNKKAYAYMDRLICEHRTRQLELEKALGIEG